MTIKNWIVRYAVEYSAQVEAESEEEAIKKAKDLLGNDWQDCGPSDYEAEEEN